MRAKRSKKYRKIMSIYNLQFDFRTPYQVICESNFLRQCHAFHMPVQKSLENTLHGTSRPYITQCSLAKVTADHKGKGRGDGKPAWLPPPTEVPLRYCKHKDSEGNELGILDEKECLIDLVSGQPKGNEIRKNKNHYILATADSIEEEQMQKQENSRSRKRGKDVREVARQIPGVPIIYVKRSVMILEEPSGVSERTIRGVEKDKLKEGLIGDNRGLKRKRDDIDSDSDIDTIKKQPGPKGPRLKKAKGPNPLSVRKKKLRPATGLEHEQNKGSGQQDNETAQDQKKRRKRTHRKAGHGQSAGTIIASGATSIGVEA